MRQSRLFTKTSREIPKGEEALNAQLLIRGGFVDKTMAGVYSYLPLGLRVLFNIEEIVREEMNAIGAQEILMPALHPKEAWEATGRWNDLDVLFKVQSHFDRQYGLGPTHEEIIAPLMKRFIFSYKDLPFGAYQIQTKFRDEARSKSGLLRGREFRMKDLYSFHVSEEDMLSYYENVKRAYENIFSRIGLDVVLTEASGGTFSKYSHEFQVLAENGEDIVFHCACGFSQNHEIIDESLSSLRAGEEGPCPSCRGTLRADAAIEVGNIFQLKNKYSDPFNLVFTDDNGDEYPVMMGCYGIGTSRLMGSVVEVSRDENGIIWPDSVAPFQVHLLELSGGNGEELYANLQKWGIAVLYDERDLSPGGKFADADLIGIPWRVVTSAKTGSRIEVKRRGESDTRLCDLDEFIALLEGK